MYSHVNIEYYVCIHFFKREREREAKKWKKFSILTCAYIFFEREREEKNVCCNQLFNVYLCDYLNEPDVKWCKTDSISFKITLIKEYFFKF